MLRRSPRSRLARLAAMPRIYAKLAWWGLVAPRATERRPLRIVQAAILGPEGVLLSVRCDLRGWELPGGNLAPGESDAEALRREVREETGLDVEVVRPVGEYVRTGFRPHTAAVYVCRPVGGAARPSAETPRVAWFPTDRLPDTLFPWYRAPLRDALAGGAPVVRHEHQGLGAVLAGFRIDARMRWSGDRAG